MTANPATDQLVADFGALIRDSENTAPLPLSARSDIAAFADRLAGALPDLAPDVVGEVMLHAADVFSEFATDDGRVPISAEAAVAVRMFCEVGLRLYLGDDRAVAL